ncbi:uncharacterized protein F5891DRAFT_949494 [Suillus fuscotomentosus]|uniref:RING-type domain-containing protein n=1 Tax=Suillus fuscotomentosus TaxID=1912939 RepID=A0AAD4E9S0_9AGAM|nr:uncharacterized protein F5891DRAFT_949494 [Suillus fuscotomentosus]KAG1902274.1 hypothetical protein F5891DRAFT_949494 [Suillus fuscotomentosus]
MASISTWYHNQYSTWNRTRRLHATPFLARTDTHTSRTATSMARTNTQDAVIINMDDDSSKKEKKQETLFGPNIGVVGSTPQWAQSLGQKAPADNVSSNIIQNWITRSKEPSQPTTTLQALVNLKRPTLRLCPLIISSGDDPDQVDSHHNHGLEFEYDCDAAKCRINVSVVLPADHPYAETIDSTGYSCISVFESIVDGGFGKVLHLDEGATLELGRFEHQHIEAETVSSQITGVPESSRAADSVDSSAPASSRNDRVRKRFTGFNFRKRSTSTSVSGPALAVVDAEVSAPTVEGSEEKGDKEEVKDGVRVTIRLSALDEGGTDLSVVNEQITYLHVVRFGTAPDDEKEDTRSWVVKVVKREATIGPHTFHLHEIYGLSSQSTSSSQPHAASSTPDAHTYPPTSASAAPIHEDEPSSECLLCLSSPREVILLPCRHLVACKECAINMVEFGAGGNIIHTEETTTAPAGGEASATEGSAPAPVPTTIAQNIRRKRKAKGWFCPVCRRPYTSLLRISTTPPTKDISDDEHRASIDEHEHEDDEHEHEHEHEREDEHDDDPLATAPPAPGGMFNSIRSGLMRLSVARSDGEHTAEATESEHPAEVPVSIV